MNELTLAHTTTEDGYYLSGLLYSPVEKQGNVAAVFIHGFTSDFYSWPFVQQIGTSLSTQGIPMIAGQTRGSGLYTEIIKVGLEDSEYIGSYYEKIEDAHYDISAWIDYLKLLGYEKFILVGHSYGTHKVVRYLFEGKHRNDVVKLSLMGPFDKNAFLQRKVGDGWQEYVQEVKKKVDEGKGLDLIPLTHEDFPMTLQTFYSWYAPGELNEMWDFYRMKSDYDFPVWKKVTLPVQIVTGREDDSSLGYPEFYSKDEVYEKMKKMIPGVDLRVIEGSDHCFVGYEEVAAKAVAEFVLR